MRRRYMWMAVVTLLIAAKLILGARGKPTQTHSQGGGGQKGRPSLLDELQHVKDADDQSHQALSDRLRPVADMLDAARAGAPEFARSALSLRGKWDFLTGMFDRPARERQMEAKFGEIVLDPAKLQQAVEFACRGFAADQERIDNDFLVRLRADEPDLPPVTFPKVQVDVIVAAEARDMSRTVCLRVSEDLAVSAATEVASQVAGQIAAGVALSAGRAAADKLGFDVGEEPSTATRLIVGVATSVAIDQAMDYAVRRAGYTPEENVAAAVVAGVETIDRVILGADRSNLNGELVKVLLNVHNQRKFLRFNTVTRGGR